MASNWLAKKLQDSDSGHQSLTHGMTAVHIVVVTPPQLIT
jgi:hypothetical protein